MSTGLEDAWQNLRLTADEEQVVIVDDADDNTDELISLCLLGKLHTQCSFNPKATKSVFCNIWKPSKELVIRDLDSNLFAFQFFAASDRDYVLNEGPWAFDGSLLLLKQMTGLEVPVEVEFSTACFWVKAYDVPDKKQTISFARILASHIGEFVSYDDATVFGIDKVLCFRVDIDISNPSRRGIYIKVDDRQMWIRFKYVKLPDFCCGCGKLGHVLAGCNSVQIVEDDPNLQYGSWLRPLLSTDNSTNMIIDATTVINPGPEAFKRDEHALNIWDDRWLPRPTSFHPITPKTDAWADLKVSDLIDHNMACRHESLIR
ncbi:hypothetical protein Cgig2_016158 [Carnegiea gigantea]|uniref:CCHC-type domain-containing protein n=1 Tax=Carnegiea gigantea TaxID=171969 RepID=A0A9Q1QL98_9CARY|nr:hypothetical protein Cgig2_016158 [Carnegiea gigantea]